MPLHSGIVAGHLYSVEALIQGGADPLAVWQKNYKPLHLAVQGGYSDIVSYLLIILIGNCPNFHLNELTDDKRDPLDIAIDVKGSTECL